MGKNDRYASLSAEQRKAVDDRAGAVVAYPLMFGVIWVIMWVMFILTGDTAQEAARAAAWVAGGATVFVAAFHVTRYILVRTMKFEEE